MSELKPCDRCWAIVGSLEDRLKAQVTLTEEARRAPTEAAKPEAGLSEMERGAIENLTRFQGQCDEDGTNVVVSREALDVALDAVRRLSKSTPSAVSEAKEAGCICKGNWRLIVAENRALFDRKYTRNGQEFTFVGVVDASDDYYYLMTDDDGVAHLLSCVGSIEGHGFAQAPADGKEDGR